MDRINFYFQFLNSEFAGFPMLVRITVIVITLVAIIYISSVIRLFYLRNKIDKYSRQLYNIRNKYGLAIKDIICNPLNLDKAKIGGIMNITENDNKMNWQKNIFTDLVLGLKEQLSSECLNKDNYLNLIEILRLEEYWEKEISKGSVNRKIEGIRKLNELTDNVITGVVAPYLYHRNDGLQKIARNVYLKFEKVDAFKFLLDKKSESDFNRLDEIKLHSSFKKKAEDNELPLLTEWIENSENINFKLFLIREIAYFHQNESTPYLADLLERSTNSLLKTEITKTLNVLNYDEVSSNLSSQLKQYNKSLQYK